MNNNEKPMLKETYNAVKYVDEISSKRNISAPVLKAYINAYGFLYDRIANETIIPKLKDSELIETWISNRNWLMIPPKDCFSREEAKNSPYPNIWIYVSEDLENMESGLHWAQAKSVDNFLNLLDTLNNVAREKLRGVFKSLNKDYEIVTQRKIHEKGLAPAAPSDFKDVKRWNLKEFDSDCADQILKSVEEIRKEGKQLRESGEVEWSVPSIGIEYLDMKGDDYESLLEVVMDFIKILKVCHETLTQMQMRKIRRNLEKDFDYAAIKRRYEHLQLLLRLNNITEEIFDKKLEELNYIIKEYNLAFNKNLELLK